MIEIYTRLSGILEIVIENRQLRKKSMIRKSEFKIFRRNIH